MSEPVTSTDRGWVRGLATPHGFAFRGIPFARAPFGPRRFRAPEPTGRWQGVRPATQSAPTAPQPATGFTMIPEPTIDGGDSPECLSLNVFTPELGAAGLPVMVWIHGGGFATGTPSSTWYDGDRFARDGVVVVSVGYRLGAEGFLSIPGAPDNRAVMDWLAALEWVQRNVAFFGGDPNRVTVAGQSAGGAATMLLTTLPKARGLFRAAIPMSGTIFPTPSAEESLALTEGFARHLGIAPKVSEFERFSPADLVEAQTAVTAPRPRSVGNGVRRDLPFCPVVDGEVVPRHPMEAVASGAGSDLALLVGTTSEEFTATARRPAMTEQRAEKRLAALGLADAGQVAYRARNADPGLRVAQAVTDRTFRMPALRVAEARSAAPAPTFAYEFSWRTPALGGLGAVHCLDIPFVFDVLDDGHAKVVAGEDAPQQLADDMHGRWVAFVKDNDAGWTPFEGTTRATMVFDATSEVVEDLLGPIRSFWS